MTDVLELEPEISEPPPAQPDTSDPNDNDPANADPDINNPAEDNLEGTVFSPAFRFVEWRSYYVSTGNYSDWGPDVDFVDPAAKFQPAYQELERKWVYVFRDLCGQLTWSGEFYAADGKSLQPVDLEGFEDRERDDRPEPSAAIRKLRLPHTVNGHPAYYYAFATRIRLPIDVIHQLVTNKRVRALLPCLNVKTRGYSANPDRDEKAHRLQWTGEEWLLCAVDPLTIALTLSDIYRDACDLRIRYVAIGDAKSFGDKLKVQERDSKKVVGKMIKALAASDPAMAGKILPLLKGGSLANIDAFLKKEEATIERLVRGADRRAATLCNWLCGELFQLTQTAHFIEESWDTAKFLNVYGQVIDRLFESGPGKGYLTEIYEDLGHFVHTYVLPALPATDVQFQIGRKCSAALFVVWKELAPVVARKLGDKAADILARALNNISRTADMVTTVRRIAPSGRVWKPSRRSKEALYSAFPTAEQLKNSNLAQWLKAGEGKTAKVANVFVVVEFVNIAFAVNSLREANLDIDGAFTVMGAVGSSLDLYSACKVAFGAADDLLLAPIGMVSAIIDFMSSVKDMYKAVGRHDYGALVGSGIAATGSALIAFGCYTAWVAAGASGTGVGLGPGVAIGIVGAVLVGAGVVVSAVAGHSDVEIFVNHCAFGKNFGTGGEMSWSSGPMLEWEGNPGRQVEALCAIVSDLEIAAVAPGLAAVKINFGLVNGRSVFYVDFRTSYSDGRKYRSIVRFDMWTSGMSKVFGEPLDETAFKLFGQTVAIEARYPVLQDTPIECVTADCSVYLDYYGNGEYKIPRTQQGVEPLKLELI